MFRTEFFEEYSLPHLLETIKLWCFEYENQYSKFRVEDVVIHQDDERFWVAKVWYWMP